MQAIEDIKTLKVVKYKTTQSLLFFTRYFYKIRQGRKFVVNDHHEIICEALEKVLRGELTRLIINIAPRYSKTELAVKNFIAHGLALNPAAKFIHLTYAAKLALDNSEEAKDIVLHPEYQRLFPVQIKKDSKAKEKWYTTAGGGVYAAASGGQVTGFGAGKVDDEEAEAAAEDRKREEELKDEISAFDQSVTEYQEKGLFGGAIIIDDPIKPEDAYSEVKRLRINERFETTIRNRVNSRRTPIIVIQQRVHQEDLSGYLMKIEPGEWTVIRLPCLRDDGTALWPMKHTVEELQHLNLVNAYVFQAQYQQDPKPIRKGGEAYKQFTTERNVIENRILDGLPELYDPELPLHLTFDFNVVPHMTLLIHQVKGKRVVQIDEICPKHPRNRTEATCQEFEHKYGPVHESTLYVYGDPAGKHEDTRTEKGENDFTIIMKALKKFKPEKRVSEKAPGVALRIRWIDSVFAAGLYGLEFVVGSNCIITIADYQFGKEDSDGTKLKEKVKDPVTGQSYEKYHHCTDANDYFYCRCFGGEWAKYQSGDSGAAPRTGKPNSKNTY